MRRCRARTPRRTSAWAARWGGGRGCGNRPAHDYDYDYDHDHDHRTGTVTLSSPVDLSERLDPATLHVGEEITVTPARVATSAVPGVPVVDVVQGSTRGVRADARRGRAAGTLRV
ncbi:hypothetical protein [Cellulomonas dongxiuzhuiae]|uniref:Uncharacterized protein n=1 Tax=Cellulomonas dongxiuzhuiae TaxID=2819979 RepID=A0ABX8GLM1_9CELL|nr:hypothetical protein [Cellulomonas dongxiuzhuiae]MBO3096624.1 hypothetical protein [Cellulomonas dongxiuzhuiae]QWC17004.1 hypothetical protein KKR89_05130 [Cellulomonas dongxiuzhuiae]